jgi:voltage-gated potassium channel
VANLPWRTGRTLDLVALPEPYVSPWLRIANRLVAAVGLLLLVAVAVYLMRDHYVDSTDPLGAEGRITFLEAFYYATVSLSTTGYGDITPVTAAAKLFTAVVVLPAKMLFMILVIGSSLEVLTEQSRKLMRISRWEKEMGEHVVVIGYGTKGRSAVDTLVSNGWNRERIVVVDPNPEAIADAHADRLAVITGDATRRDVLRRAGINTADQIVITTDRDDTNVLATLTVRQVDPEAFIVTAVREQENAALMKQSGANSVITSADAVGRLLGLSSVSPSLGSVLEDLLTHGSGLEVAERELLASEVGKQPQSLPDQVLGVVRDERVYRYFDPVVGLLARGDRLIVVRPSEDLPWAPRPGTHNEELASDDVG